MLQDKSKKIQAGFRLCGNLTVFIINGLSRYGRTFFWSFLSLYEFSEDAIQILFCYSEVVNICLHTIYFCAAAFNEHLCYAGVKEQSTL